MRRVVIISFFLILNIFSIIGGAFLKVDNDADLTNATIHQTVQQNVANNDWLNDLADKLEDENFSFDQIFHTESARISTQSVYKYRVYTTSNFSFTTKIKSSVKAFMPLAENAATIWIAILHLFLYTPF